jgi:hypothetical protein
MTLSLVIGVLKTALALQGQAALPPMWGVTIDDTSNVSGIVTSISKFRAKPTARVVFDPGMNPVDYISDVRAIAKVANIMGQPVDSFSANQYTPDQYRARMAAYMDGFGSLVPIWEIGNESNGEWTGTTLNQSNRIAAAFQEARKRHRATALTLFYSDLYVGTPRDITLWGTRYLSPTVRNGLDYVLVSFYPTSATGPHPNWPIIFAALAKSYPNAKVGFGELGLATPNGDLSTDPVQKKALLLRYYSMKSPLPSRYINGYFWWTFAEDAVPYNKGLWLYFYNYIR